MKAPHVPPVASEHVAHDIVRNVDSTSARMPTQRPRPALVVELPKAVQRRRAQPRTQIRKHEPDIRRRGAGTDEHAGLPGGRLLDEREQRLLPPTVAGNRVDVVDAHESTLTEPSDRIDVLRAPIAHRRERDRVPAGACRLTRRLEQMGFPRAGVTYDQHSLRRVVSGDPPDRVHELRVLLCRLEISESPRTR